MAIEHTDNTPIMYCSYFVNLNLCVFTVVRFLHYKGTVAVLCKI